MVRGSAQVESIACKPVLVPIVVSSLDVMSVAYVVDSLGLHLCHWPLWSN